jgi:hypothetical protein
LGPKYFNEAINAISMALFILQKDKALRHTFNITMLANKILETQKTVQYKLNRGETICILYYIQQNMETVIMSTDTDEMPTWSIREDIFKSLCIED